MEGQANLFCQNFRHHQWGKIYPHFKRIIANHINTARNALLCYIAESGNPALPMVK